MHDLVTADDLSDGGGTICGSVHHGLQGTPGPGVHRRRYGGTLDPAGLIWSLSRVTSGRSSTPQVCDRAPVECPPVPLGCYSNQTELEGRKEVEGFECRGGHTFFDPTSDPSRV